MKDSGVEWIGQIPEEWEVKRLKFVMNNKDYERKPIEATERSQKGEILYDYYGASGVIDKIDQYIIEGENLLIGEDGANLVMRNLPLIYIANGKYWVNNHAHILHPKIGNLHYFAHQMEIIDYTCFITGSAQPKLSQENLNNVELIVPPIVEQQLIAYFLDDKVRQIDGILSDLNKQIDILNKYKKSLITETVTKGLDPNVKMKNSGIDWIGVIPKHWEVKIMKNISKLKGRIGWQGLTADEYIDEGPYLITGVDFKNGNIDWDSCEHVSKWRYNQAPEIQIKDNDLLITKDGTVGKVALVKNAPRFVTLNSGILLIRKIKDDYINRFLYYVLISEEFWHWFEIINIGNTTIIHLYQNIFAKFKLTLPPLNEQKEICDFLDKKCSEIDSAISDKQKQIETMEKLKKSLIYEYVTGKKRVGGELKCQEISLESEKTFSSIL